MAEGTDFFERSLDSCANELRQPSLLPGWNRAHVASHVARNADALCNLLAWSRSGVETPMYAGPDQRNRDIETGALREPAVIRTDVSESSERLAIAAATEPERAWEAKVRTARGREVLASQIPWMRCREVWVHALDLDGRPGFDELPEAIATALVSDVVRALSPLEVGRGVVVQLEDGGQSWRIGSGEVAWVIGQAGPILGWLSGRTGPNGLDVVGELPDVPRWL